MNDANPSGGLSRRDLSPDQQFWQLWRQGQPPNLSDFLRSRPHLNSEQVAAVLAIDQYERWIKGERVLAEQYLPLLPADADAARAACDVIYGEYLLCEQLGEHPSLVEYCRRFPQQALMLTRQVELHRALAEEPGDPSRGDGVPKTVFEGAPPPRPRAVAPEIPGYEVLDEIGRGGMGVVYKARQRCLDRVVALKVLQLGPEMRLGRSPHQSPSEMALERMQREARMTAKLSHPHIVTVYEAGTAGDSFYLAMELVPGQDLHRLVEKAGPISGQSAVHLLAQAADGLQHAAEIGLVHRDIKPSNLIITPGKPGSIGTLKILDLGLARLLAATDGDSVPLTREGAFMGTPDFIAPEQANDPRAADIRSDLYSLGCTFYYALTGLPPFSGVTPFAKLMQHHIADAPNLEGDRPGVPPALSAVLRRMMAKSPRDRFQTPSELLAALAPLLHDEATKQRGSGMVRVVSAGAGPRRRLLGHTDRVKCVAFSPDGQAIATGGLDRCVRLWHTETGQEAWRGNANAAGAVLCVAFSPDGRTLVSGGEDSTLFSWRPPMTQPIWQARGHESNINAIVYTPAGDRLLSASHDGTLRLWTSGGVAVRSWVAHTGAVWSVAIAPGGRLALSGGQDRMVRLWDVETGEAVVALAEQPAPVPAVALSPDGRQALIGGWDGLVKLWDMANRTEVRSLEGHTARCTAVAFSPDGQRAVSASRDHTLRLWDLRTGHSRQLIGHGHWVSAAAWSPQGNRIVSGGSDKVVCLWDVGEENHR